MLEVKLHDIGEGMTEGEILHYFVKPGDHVKSDQPLVEVQTDKMTAELPSPGSGVIKEIIIHAGSTVTVGTTLLIIENNEISGEESAKQQKEEKNIQSQSPLPNHSMNLARVLATPYTRKIAREQGIDLEQVTGTGPAGRITDQDVYRFIEKRKEKSAAPGQVQPSPKMTEIQQTMEKVDSTIQAVSIPFKGRRKYIAKKMVHSLYTIPHVTHFEEIDMTELLGLVKELKSLGQAISVSAFFVKAITIALSDYPVFNAKLDEENELIHLESEFNIGIATDSEEGLIVPVIRHANKKTIKDIHLEMKALTKKAQDNTLGSQEITGGTFTISNVGPLGSIGATPIINHPETGLMAFHATKEKPAVTQGEIVIRSLMNISMSFDHRVADGATAVAFTNRFKAMIENPTLLLLELV